MNNEKYLKEKKEFDEWDIDKNIEQIKKQIEDLLVKLEDLEIAKIIKQRVYSKDEPAQTISLEDLNKQYLKGKKMIEENKKLNTTLYLNDDKMAIKIIDKTVFTYDLDMLNNIEQNTEGKLIEVMDDIYKKIEDYYQIDLKDYNVKSLK